MDDETFSKIFNAATGVWALVCMFTVAFFRMWPNVMGRFNERRRDVAAEKSDDWDRLRTERDSLRDLLHQSNEEKGEWMRRAITAESTLQGMGEVRQIEAIRDAAKRLGGNLPPEEEK